MASSVGLILSFPPFPTGFLAIIALIPFFMFLRGKSPGKALLGGYFLGLVWASGTLYWIGWATIAGLICVLLLLPAYLALFAFVYAWFGKIWGDRSVLAAPILWVGMEFLTTLSVLAFPWNFLAYTQTYVPVLIQYASITGAYGVTFWIVLLNVLLYKAFIINRTPRRRRILIIFILLLFVIPWLHGRGIYSRPVEETKTIQVALIQGNIDPYEKWSPEFLTTNFEIYGRMTKSASISGPDLIIWPETATACYIRDRQYERLWMHHLVDSTGIPLLTGSPDYHWDSSTGLEKTNSAVLFMPGARTLQRYAKIKLVPFSERVPFRGSMPFIYNWAQKMDLDIGDFTPGDSLVVFRIHGDDSTTTRFSAAICYESVFPALVSRSLAEAAHFLVVITNDGWFGYTSGPYQHARIAVLRAIENRVWVARCANTGISMFIDSRGVIRKNTSWNEETVLQMDIDCTLERPFYSRHSKDIEWGILLINASLILVTGFSGFRTGRFKNRIPPVTRKSVNGKRSGERV
jgi:apolipoprotein N-acyltransferase